MDVRSFLASLPTLPEPGTPDHEFSSESFLERYEMSEVLGEVSSSCRWVAMSCCKGGAGAYAS